MTKQGSLVFVAVLALLNAASAAEWVRLDNGKDLTGWKVSSNWHGTGGKWEVVDGVIRCTQNPQGNGGLLMTTDLTYVNYEVVVQVKPNYGNDSGLFMRSTTDGKCYQIVIDYYTNGNIGAIWGEGISCVSYQTGYHFTSYNTISNNNGTYFTVADWRSIWKTANNNADWNTIHAGIIKNPPTIKVWINGRLTNVFRAQGLCNELLDKGNRGGIALQIHGGTGSWMGGPYNYYKNIYVKRLGTGDTIQGPGPLNDPYTIPSATASIPAHADAGLTLVRAGSGGTMLTASLQGQPARSLSLAVADPSGRIVENSASVFGTSASVSVKNLARGSYVAVLRGGDRRWTRAFTVGGR